MESASSEKTVIPKLKICEMKSDGFFKSNSWKATLVIVLVRKYSIFHFILR